MVLPGQSIDGTALLRSSGSGATSQIFAERVSRVYFAPDVRPSSESHRMSQTVSIYHTTIVPSRGSQVGDGSLSPTQTDGPRTLRLEDPSRRGTTSRSSIDVVIPALRRTYASSCLPLLDSTSWLQRCALVTLRVWIRRETITGPVQPPRSLVIHSPLSMRHQHQKMVKFLWRVPIPGLMGKWLAGNLGHREQGLLTMPVAWTHTIQQWTWARTSISKHKLENSQNRKRF
jgi:hypothetical protein